MTDTLRKDAEAAVAEWPRVRLPIPPCPPGLSAERTNEALLVVCAELWRQEKIPVVGWGCEFDGTELHPPVRQ